MVPGASRDELDRRALIRRYSGKTKSLAITTKYFGAHRECCVLVRRWLVPRRHGADRVEGFPCRFYTLSHAHTLTRITHVAPFRRDRTTVVLFSQFCKVTHRSDDLSEASSLRRALILFLWYYHLFFTLRRPIVSNYVCNLIHSVCRTDSAWSNISFLYERFSSIIPFVLLEESYS